VEEVDQTLDQEAQQYESSGEQRIDWLWAMPIQDLDTSVRLFNELKRNKIATLAWLSSYTKTEVLWWRGMNKRTLTELENLLEEAGIPDIRKKA
jgi:DNA-directed RNA polymerase alpha subunit